MDGRLPPLSVDLSAFDLLNRRSTVELRRMDDRQATGLPFKRGHSQLHVN